MWEDENLWPIKCPFCKNEFTQQIGSMKVADEFRCSECGTKITHSKEEFFLALAEAKKGNHDPWSEMLQIQNPTRFG